MLSNQHRRYLKAFSVFMGVLCFVFLQIIRLGDTVEYHFLFTHDFSWQAYWQFYVSSTSALFLLYALIFAMLVYWSMLAIVRLWQAIKSAK